MSLRLRRVSPRETERNGTDETNRKGLRVCRAEGRGRRRRRKDVQEEEAAVAGDKGGGAGAGQEASAPSGGVWVRLHRRRHGNGSTS